MRMVHAFETSTQAFDAIEEAIEAIARGELVVVVDDDDRENEGDLIMAAEKALPESVAFMIRHTSGILCTPMPRDMAQRLRLDPMVHTNDAPLETAFTISVDYRQGLTTGISAAERASTVRALANHNSAPQDFVRPGHIFPLLGKPGGVLVRSGHTEAAIDLATLAGVAPVGLLAELVNDDGSVKRLPELRDFAREHGLKIISIADLIRHRQKSEKLVSRVREFEIDTDAGPAHVIVYGTDFDETCHFALCFGNLDAVDCVPVRIQRENVINDIFMKLTGKRSEVLHKVLRVLERRGCGVIVYVRDPKGYTTVPEHAGDGGSSTASPAGAEAATPSDVHRQEHWREVGIGAQILRDLGVRSIDLLATSRKYYVGLAGFGIEIEHTTMID